MASLPGFHEYGFHELIPSLHPGGQLKPNSGPRGSSAEIGRSNDDSATPPSTPIHTQNELTQYVSPSRNFAHPQFPFNENTTGVMEVVEDLVQHMDLDDAYAHVWIRDPARRIYGTEAAKKPSAAFTSPPGLSAKQSRKAMSDHHHGLMERDRRDRHRILQRDAHSLCCEVANELAEHDAIYSPLKTSRKEATPKKSLIPGKDNQLVATIFQQCLTLVVARAEHTRRKTAEAQVAEQETQIAELKDEKRILERRIEKLTDCLRDSWLIQRALEDDECRPCKRKRDECDAGSIRSLAEQLSKHNHESSMSSRSQQSSYLLPSPSPSPGLHLQGEPWIMKPRISCRSEHERIRQRRPTSSSSLNHD